MLNNWCGQGRITREIEVKYTPGNVAVTSFTIACDRDYKPRDGERECDFIQVVAWRNNAEFVSKYFHKGDLINVVGRIQTRTYEDKDGVRRHITEVVGEAFYFGGSKRPDSNSQTAKNEEEGFMPLSGGFDDEAFEIFNK